MDNLGLKRGKLEFIPYDNNYERIYNEEKKNLEKNFKRNVYKNRACR